MSFVRTAFFVFFACASTLACFSAGADLDGVSGRLFKLNSESRSFELLKETEYDPKTDVGQSRFTIHLAEDARIVKLSERTTFSGLSAPLPANFRGIDDANRKALLNGEAFVARVATLFEGNAFSSSHGVRNAELWLGNYHEDGLHWDVICFNHGLHDLKQSYDQESDRFGDYAVSIEDYKKNLHQLIDILQRTGAELVWTTTTPIPNDNKSRYARRKGAARLFNQAAMEVMRQHPGIIVNDLYSVVDDSPVFDDWRKGTDVHFYKEEEQKLLGESVASAVKRAISKRRSTPNE